MPAQVDALDYWWAVRDFPAARVKRRALELLEDARHQILIRGPEGEQIHKDKAGRPIKGEGSVRFAGLERYEAELRQRAGLAVATAQPKLEKPKTKGPLGFAEMLALSKMVQVPDA